MMCDKEQLVGYLYDELPELEKRTFERHLSECGECRQEVAELRGTRVQLAQWSPPERALGFEIVQRPAQPAARKAGISPAWGLAAAAVLVLAAATALANLEVRAGRDGLVIRTGWGRSPESPAESATLSDSRGTQPPDSASRAEVQTVIDRLSDLERRVAARPAASVTSGAQGAARLSDAELIRRVRDMLAESEQRQQTVLASRIVQAVRELEAAYRTDLVRFQQGIAQNQGLRDAEVIRQRAMLDEMYRLVGQPR